MTVRSGDFEVTLNLPGVYEYMNDPSVQAYMLEQAQEVGSIASGMSGKTYEADVRPGRARAHARCTAAEHGAKVDNPRNNTLLKALGSSGASVGA